MFYRAWLQTRLEVLYGRWPAIIAQALLFALMHSFHLNSDAPLTSLATIVAFQGVFGLMLGYLWARYRNIWMIFFIHTMTNLIPVPMLMALL
ncbi:MULTISPECIES: CPBP family intramembrane glutamic endopeptidase [unclassified Nonomuraea]|uniref:CPBP family intramembrane glutamic endopeptidase n=1 Tax=unclassified Nonomuraea TaxID=2593643 RepID=UPI00191C024B|nr:CPBP family intramembrane glutamic endopeptidase [Nonomuraea sp. KC401]